MSSRATATSAATAPAPHAGGRPGAQRLARAMLWIVPLLWSTNYLIARAADGVIAPHLLALGRWVMAGLIMLPFVWRGLRRDGMPWRSEWRQVLVLGALGMWICGAIVYLGGQTTSSTNIALIYAATPILIALASARLLHETLSPTQRVGVALALAGVLFVIAQGDPARLLAVRFTAGDGWIVVAAVSWAAYSVLLRRWPSTLGPAERLVVIIGGGVLVLLPFTLLEWWLMPRHPASWQAIGLVAAAALVPGVLSYSAYSYMQRELGASRTALVMYLSPVYAAVGAWAVLGEAPGWYHAVGAALILPSIWLATRR
jgi:drug/metabolite transporter (DMT)-like permease